MNEQRRYDPGRASGVQMLSPRDARNRVAHSEIRLIRDPDAIIDQILWIGAWDRHRALVSY
jgi:hypothetical protein